MNIIAALDDANLFGGVIRDPATFAAWRAFLACLFGLEVPENARPLATQCTGLQQLPEGGYNEAWLVCGRRAGKSFVLALIAVYLACFRDYSDALTRGERGTIMVIAADRKQARTILRYIRGLLSVPILANLVGRETADAFDLDNRVTIEIGTASIKSVRGYTIVAALCGELAFWPSEDSTTPDYEILDSLRPGMAIRGGMLLCASSPYARRGALWDAHKRYFGNPDAPVLVWQAPTRTMNPTVPQSVIDQAMDRDAASASAEYLAEFRSDLESFVAREVVEAAVIPGRFELPPTPSVRYSAFVDPSGGSSDSMTLAISHRDGNGHVIVDAVREVRPPFSPESVTAEFSGLLKGYGVHTVVGDRYAGEWPRERFQRNNIRYEPSDRPKSDIYRDTLPLLNSGHVELLDNMRLILQFCSLERRTARGGRDSIDHPPGLHDDIANAVAGSIISASSRPGHWVVTDALLAIASRPSSSPYWRR